MNILIVSDNFKKGGLETHIHTLYSCLKSKDTFYFAFSDYDSALPLPQENVYTGFHFHMEDTVAVFREDVSRLVAILREKNIKAINVHPFYGLFPAMAASQQTGIPLAYTYHGAISYNFGLHPTDKALIRFGLSTLASCVFCVTNSNRELLEKRAHIPHTIYLPNAVDSRRYREHRVMKNGCWAYISRLDADGGKCETLRRVFSLLGQPGMEHIDIFGDGTRREELEEYVRAHDLGRQVTFMGFRSDLSEYLDGKYNGVIGMGRAALEGLAMGYPVLLAGYGKLVGLMDLSLYEKARNVNFVASQFLDGSETLAPALQTAAETPEQYNLRSVVCRELDVSSVGELYHRELSSITVSIQGYFQKWVDELARDDWQEEKIYRSEAVYDALCEQLRVFAVFPDLQDRMEIGKNEYVRNQQVEREKSMEEFGKAFGELTHLLADTSARLGQKSEQLSKTEQQLSKTEQKLSQAEEALTQTEEKLSQAGEALTQTEKKLSQAEEELIQTEERLSQTEKELSQTRDSFIGATAERDDLREECARLQRKLDEALANQYNPGEDILLDSIEAVVQDSLRSRVYRWAYLFHRWMRQGVRGSRVERRAFRRWLKSKLLRKPVETEDTVYHPFRRIQMLLEQERASIALHPVSSFREERRDGNPCLGERYDRFDVIIFSVIDYHFRYQRPQQIADGFAGRGHRVFYINANFAGQKMKAEQERENLWLITLPNNLHPSVYSTDFRDDGIDLRSTLDTLVRDYAIRDGLMIADYPTWVSGLRYLKKKYGFGLITDYMDDFGGFDNAEQSIVVNDCIRLLQSSDLVVASSAYLAELAGKYNQQVKIIRNGTEYEHFHRAFLPAAEKSRKTIGYYGAISHWFDCGKIVALSKAYPEAEIILIGDVTAHRDTLEKLPNVRLLGEMKYDRLPEHLAGFDVCLIPFDTTTNLIKATNPVKFYEYLSAGKKVVATAIPELEPYRDRFVYMADGDEAFVRYVGLCLAGEDTLADAEECMAFARENDWTERVNAFCQCAEAVFPKISIVVLCYNQLEYTKLCVDSILRNTAYPNYELVLVDNCSGDGTADWIRNMEKENSRIVGVINTVNRGFAGGNNDGIRASTGDYILLLNNDTLVTRGWLTGLWKHFSDNRSVGIVGPVTNSIGNEAMISVSYTRTENMSAFAYDYTADNMGQVYPGVKVLAMFCVLISRKVVEEIGLLDESYGVGMFEDDDYSEAAKAAGFSLVLAEDVFVHHFGSVSFKKLESETHRKLFEKNKAYYERKWEKTWEPHRYRPELRT